MTSLFISYSRKDTVAARKLTEAFKGQQLDFWIDWEGIPPTVDWWREIEKGIEEADIFLFLISPDSARSKICKQEIQHAIQNGKRLIPVVVREVQDDESPEELRHLNWAFFRENDEFDLAFDKLMTAIKTDYEWVQTHRELQVKALEWERSNHEDSFLLRGTELRDAEFQLATNTSKEPHPTDLQRTYVFKSRQASDQQRRRTRIIAIGVIIALTVLAVVAFVQAGRATTNANEAQTQAAIARTNEEEAQKQAAIALARELAAISITNLDLDPDLSLHLAMQSLDKIQTTQGEEALRRALVAPPVKLTLQGHSGAVYSVAYDSEGKRLVTASEDGTARIWDAATGDEIMVLRGHNGAVKSAAFSPDGQFVATAGTDGTVRLWDSKTGQELRSMKHRAAINSVAFSPDGKYIVTASDDKTARIWQVSTGDEIHKLEEHSAAVRCAVFSPDGALIATGGNDQRLHFWDAATGELIDSIDTGSENVSTVAFSADSKYVLLDWLHNAYRWDVLNATVATKYFGGHNWYVTSVAFNPSDGRQVVTASRDHTVQLWETESDDPDTKKVDPIAVLRGQSGVIYSVAFDATGDHLATASEDQTVRIWGIAEWRKRTLIGYSGFLTHAVFSSDARKIASIGSDTMIRIWDASTGRQLNAWQYQDGYPNRVQYSPDDKQLITSGDDGTWRLWDAETGEQLYQSDPIGYVVSDARFNSEGTRIITTARDNLAVVWDAKTREKLFTLEGHRNGIWTGMFSRDGQFAVTASADHTARVWNVQTGKQLQVLSGHKDLITSAAFSPDGKRIVTASVDGTARIWDTKTGNMLLTLNGHTSEVTEALFSPTDPYVATASRDHTVILWNAETGDEIVQLFGHNKDILHIAFSPDGKYLLTASLDGTARIFPVRFKDVLALGRSLLSKRELTCEERVKYLHEEIVCPTPTPMLTPTP